MKSEKRKMAKVQSSMQNFFQQIKIPSSDNEPTQDLPDEATLEQNEPETVTETQTPSRRKRRKRKQVDNIDNYKIVRRTNMITYQRRFQAHQKCLNTEMSERQFIPRSKRWLNM